MRGWCLIVCLCGIPALGADRQGEVDGWIGQLTSDDWKARQQAFDRLVGLGEDAVPRLGQLAQTADDNEVRTRAQAAISQIRENRMTGASLITLRLDNVAAAQAFSEVFRQAGAVLPTEPANLLSQKSLKRVSLECDHRPFWEVVQSLCAQTGLEVAPITRKGREAGLGLARGSLDWLDRPIVLSGPLLIRAEALNRRSTIRLKPPGERTEEFNITLTAFAEPKMKVLDVSPTLQLEEVVDERGNSLAPPGEEGNPANADVFEGGREPGTSHWELGATLHHPKGRGKRIVKLRGRAKLIVQTRSGTLDLPLAGLRNVTQTVEGLRVLVKGVEGGRCELSVYRDGRADQDWYAVRMRVAAGEARLLDDKGQVAARTQGVLDVDESPDNQRLDVRLRFAKESAEDVREGKKRSADATKFSWEFPLEVRELGVPLELRDLPIP